MSKKQTLNATIDPEVYDALKELGETTSQPVSTLVNQILQERFSGSSIGFTTDVEWLLKESVPSYAEWMLDECCEPLFQGAWNITSTVSGRIVAHVVAATITRGEQLQSVFLKLNELLADLLENLKLKEADQIKVVLLVPYRLDKGNRVWRMIKNVPNIEVVTVNSFGHELKKWFKEEERVVTGKAQAKISLSGSATATVIKTAGGLVKMEGSKPVISVVAARNQYAHGVTTTPPPSKPQHQNEFLKLSYSLAAYYIDLSTLLRCYGKITDGQVEELVSISARVFKLANRNKDEKQDAVEDWQRYTATLGQLQTSKDTFKQELASVVEPSPQFVWDKLTDYLIKVTNKLAETFDIKSFAGRPPTPSIDLVRQLTRDLAADAPVLLLAEHLGTGLLSFPESEAFRTAYRKRWLEQTLADEQLIGKHIIAATMSGREDICSALRDYIATARYFIEGQANRHGSLENQDGTFELLITECLNAVSMMAEDVQVIWAGYQLPKVDFYPIQKEFPLIRRFALVEEFLRFCTPGPAFTVSDKERSDTFDRVCPSFSDVRTAAAGSKFCKQHLSPIDGWWNELRNREAALPQVWGRD